MRSEQRREIPVADVVGYERIGTGSGDDLCRYIVCDVTLLVEDENYMRRLRDMIPEKNALAKLFCARSLAW